MVVAAWWPFADGFPHQYWNTDIGFHRSAIVCIPVVLAAMYWIFRKHGSLLLLLSAILVLALCFAHLVYIGYVRHWGIVVLGFLVALWILCYEQSQRRLRLSRVAYVFLALGALKGVGAMAASWTHPFSETANAAAWIRAHHDEALPLVGSLDYNLAGVAEQMERPAYFLNCNCVDTYMKFSHRRDGMLPSEIPDRIARAYSVLHASQILLVMDSPMSAGDIQRIAEKGLRVDSLADFKGSEDHLELHLYRAEPMSAPGR